MLPEVGVRGCSRLCLGLSDEGQGPSLRLPIFPLAPLSEVLVLPYHYLENKSLGDQN